MSQVIHFLYVEDDETSRMVMEVLLPYWDHASDLVLFENSENFISRLESLSPRPDVIFLDIHVSPYTGFEMLEMIRKHPALNDVTVIAVTASVMSEEINNLMSAGFNGAIAKPLDREAFPELLSRICDGESVWHVN